MVTMLLGLSLSSWPVITREVVRRMMSRGVKCSPAVSLKLSANLRINSSKMMLMPKLLMHSGLRSITAKRWTTGYSSSAVASC
ncbi:hypothetical protein D9M71_663270 [compost metagenome]